MTSPAHIIVADPAEDAALQRQILALANARDRRGMLMLVSVGCITRELRISEDRAIGLIHRLEGQGKLSRHASGKAWSLC